MPQILLNRLGWLALPLALALSVTGRAEGLPLLEGDLEIRPKSSAPTQSLLVPYFEIDTTDPDGVTTLFALRNQVTEAIAVQVSYHRRNGSIQRFHSDDDEPIVLGPKQTFVVNIRDVADLEIDEDGFQRGFVRIEAPEGARLVGDYFNLNRAQAFADGSRMVGLAPSGPARDLCEVFVIRYLNGGVFAGGTKLQFWLDLEVPPSNEDPIASYVVYNLNGDITGINTIFSDQVAFEVPIEDLFFGQPSEAFGAIELQFSGETQGFVSATYDALAIFSVGLEATCLD